LNGEVLRERGSESSQDEVEKVQSGRYVGELSTVCEKSIFERHPNSKAKMTEKEDSDAGLNPKAAAVGSVLKFWLTLLKVPTPRLKKRRGRTG